MAIAKGIIIIDVRSLSLSKASGNALRRDSSISLRLLWFVTFVRAVLICRIRTEIKPIVRAVGIQQGNKPYHYRLDLTLALVCFWL